MLPKATQFYTVSLLNFIGSFSSFFHAESDGSHLCTLHPISAPLPFARKQYKEVTGVKTEVTQAWVNLGCAIEHQCVFGVVKE